VIGTHLLVYNAWWPSRIPDPVDEQDHESHRLVADLHATPARRGCNADGTALVERLRAAGDCRIRRSGGSCSTARSC
jgi:hypothetical protein